LQNTPDFCVFIKIILIFCVIQISPLDVAADEDHVDCVRLILDQTIVKKNPDHAKDGYTSLACVADSATAVKHLLKAKPERADLRKAVEIAMHRSQPECLDLLLTYGVKTDSMFDKMNLYHVLYTYSSAVTFLRDGYSRLPRMTSVLVRHKYDVNACSPTNTYPMYSLLRNCLCAHDYTHTQHYLECLKLLLKAGANPNFDEFKFEVLQHRKGKKSVHGRPAFSSALHCLLDTVEMYAAFFSSKALAVKYIIQCADILVQNRAQVNVIGRVGNHSNAMLGSVLHQYARTCVTIGVDNEVMKFLLRQGADPDGKVKGKFMINTFCDTLFGNLGSMPPWKVQPDMTSDVKQILDICYHMSRPSLKEAHQMLKKEYAHNPAASVKKYLPVVASALEKQYEEVWPLKRHCKHLLWRLCKRDAHNVHALPCTSRLKTDILPITL
jgi:hypothetical protein